jgi:methylated-DNA-[protein]-cysteine S-methyltransferase
MTIRMTTLDTAVARFTLAARGDVIVAAGFGTADDVRAWLPHEHVEPVADLGELSAAVQCYFDGDLTALDDLPVEQPGGEFRQAAWKAMRAVPPGETISYAELAARSGSPSAVRAAGSACARNRIAVIVPCHRIVQTGGGRGGYAYGLPTKEWLLAHERGER